MNPRESIGERLGETLSKVSYESRTSESIHEMKRLTLDFFGVALAGSQTETGRIAGEYVTDLGGTSTASVIGRMVRVPAENAAFANAISSHSIELDDVDEDAYFHFAPPVVSAALAVGQEMSASGTAVLNAMLVGCEMMLRLSRATNPSLRDHGFHTTAACGVFGAAAASARILELSPEQFTSALGLAGAQASGLMEMYGPSMQKRINPGPAARGGVTSAQLAARGFTGAETIFEGERGFGAAFAGSLDPGPLLDGLGSEMDIPIEYKPYSCARPIHNAIDCALEVRDSLGRDTTSIEEITIRRHPRWASYHLNFSPTTYHEAQMSLPYSVAIALIDGQALPHGYRNERVASDREVARLMSLMSVEPDPTLPRGVSCHMTATTNDSHTFTSQIDYPLGSSQNPLDDAALAEKASFLGEPVIQAERTAELITKILEMDSLEDVSQLVDLASVDPTGE